MRFARSGKKFCGFQKRKKKSYVLKGEIFFNNEVTTGIITEWHSGFDLKRGVKQEKEPRYG